MIKFTTEKVGDGMDSTRTYLHENGVQCGFAQLCFTRVFDKVITDDIKKFKHLFVMSVYVPTEFRNKGYGTLLMNNIIKHSKERKIEILILGVERNNVSGMKLYETLGFTTFGDLYNCNVMSLKLNNI